MSATRERVDMVARVLASVAPAIADNTLTSRALRDALDIESHSLIDLPEVAFALGVSDIRLLTPLPVVDVSDMVDVSEMVDLRHPIDAVDLRERAAQPTFEPGSGARPRLHPHSSPVAFEEFLTQRLADVALIGEIGLEPYAGKLERSINELTKRMAIDVVSRDFPATFAAFLVKRSLHHVEDQSFFARLPQSAFRRSGEVVDSFDRAIDLLGAPSFDEVSDRDGPDSRAHHVRRMQLHGGVPVAVVEDVMSALCDSLAAGARSPREIAQDWLVGGEPLGMGVGRPVRRLLTCTDHGARMLDAFVALVRNRQLGGTDRSWAPLDATTIDRANAWLDAHPELAKATAGVSVRPSLRAPIKRRSGPDIVLPLSIASWYHDRELIGRGSPTRSRIVPLADPTQTWTLQGRTDTRAPLVNATFSSASPSSVILIFDEHGRYHHHALPLGGRKATVIAPSRTHVSGETDRVNLVGRWTGYQQVDVHLAKLTLLEIVTPDHLVINVDIDRELGARIVGPQIVGPPTIGGQSVELSGLAGEPVFTDVPSLVFTGFVPPISELAVIVSDAEGACDAFLDETTMVPERRGVFDLRELIGDDTASLSTVEVQCEGFESESTTVVTVPGLRLAAVPPLDPQGEVRLDLELAPGYVLDPEVVVVGRGETSATFVVESPDGEIIGLRVTVPRLDQDTRSGLIPEHRLV